MRIELFKLFYGTGLICYAGKYEAFAAASANAIQRWCQTAAAAADRMTTSAIASFKLSFSFQALVVFGLRNVFRWCNHNSRHFLATRAGGKEQCRSGKCRYELGTGVVSSHLKFLGSVR